MSKLVKLVKKTQSNLAENSVKCGKTWVVKGGKISQWSKTRTCQDSIG